MTKYRTFIEVDPLYEYNHNGRTWRFEVPSIGAPQPVLKDGSLSKRVPPLEFYDAIEAWWKEPDHEKYRIE